MKVEKLSKNIWIEFNPFVLNKINLSKDHNIGEKLFCPLFDKAGREIFPESDDIKAGDIVLHFSDRKVFTGSSLVVSKTKKIVTHDNFGDCAEFDLKYYKPISPNVLISTFLDDYNNLACLDLIFELSETFYTKNLTLKRNNYIFPVSKELLSLLNNYFTRTLRSQSNIPHITNNLIYDKNNLELEQFMTNNFDDISKVNVDIGSKFGSKIQKHDNDLKIISKWLIELGFNNVDTNIRYPSGQGDVDLVAVHEKTLIIIDYKSGKNVRSDFKDFKSKKDKMINFLINEYEELKNIEKNKFVFIMICSGTSPKKLSEIVEDLEKKKILLKNTIIEKNVETNEENEIRTTQIFHKNQIESYYEMGKQVDMAYGKRDFLKDLNISPEDSEVMKIPSFKITHKLRGYETFLFSCSPKKLAKYASVARRIPGTTTEASYQRLIDGNRLKTIASNFLDKEQGYFPNNVVIKLDESKINFKSMTKFFKENDFEDIDVFFKNPDYPYSDFGVLEIKEDYNSAWVIDGQHRLFSHLKSPENAMDSINVAAMVKLDTKEEVSFFVDINDNAKKVDADLIWDLNGIIDKESPDGIISNAVKLMYGISISEEDTELNIFKNNLRIPSYERKRGYSFGGLCRTLRDDCEITKLDISSKSKNKKWNHREKIYEGWRNPFVVKGGNTMSKRIAENFVDFFTNIKSRLNAERYAGKYSFFNEAGVAVMAQLAMNFFKYKERHFIKEEDSDFFDAIAKIINGYSNTEMTFIRKQASTLGKSDTLKDIILQLTENENFIDFDKRVAPKLVQDVKELMEPIYEDSLGEFVYLKIKSLYNVNFVTDFNFWTEAEVETFTKDNNRKGLGNNTKDLYKRILIRDIKDKVIFRNSPFKYYDKSKNLIEIKNLWNECFKDVFLYTTKNYGYKSKNELQAAFDHLTQYKNDTSSHDGPLRDNFDPTNRAIVKAHYEMMRKILDNEFKGLK